MADSRTGIGNIQVELIPSYNARRYGRASKREEKPHSEGNMSEESGSQLEEFPMAKCGANSHILRPKVKMSILGSILIKIAY